MSTIGAIATAAGEGSIGIVRLSGDNALKIAQCIFIPANKKKVDKFLTHKAIYGHIIDPSSDDIIDESLMITMHAPNSYTAEDVVEFQCHGGIVPLRRVLELALKQGARLAEPGEFTRRAFLNGKMDLVQAQAVMDIIRSKTDASLRMAIGHLEGQLSKKINQCRLKILRMIAHLEATIDFPEDDIDEITVDSVKNDVIDVKNDIEQLLNTKNTGKILRNGLETVIIGKPNVGKSSLLNTLLDENKAIVTDIAGTTRDAIEEYVNIGGIPLKIIDTAGIREAKNLVEQMGIEKAKAYIQRADLILALFDFSSGVFSTEDNEILHLIQNRNAIVLLNKCDLEQKFALNFIKKKFEKYPVIKISAKSGQGIKELEKIIISLVYDGKMQHSENVFINSLYQAEILQNATYHLEEALATIKRDLSIDLIEIDLRASWEILGKITGDTIDDDIVNQIFSQFCIGK